MKIATGWTGWWVQGPDAGRGYLVRPEFYVKRFGVWPHVNVAQGIQSTYATHQGGVFQVVQLPPGSRALTVECQARYHSRHTDGNGGALGTRIGLDPTGQTDSALASTIVWGEWAGQDTGWDGKTWRTLDAHVDAAQLGGSQLVTVWLESRNRWKARDNHTWWDNLLLRAEVGGDVDPPEVPPDLAAWLGRIEDKLDQVLERLP